MQVRSNKHAVQFALCVAVFLVPFMGSSLNLAMPLIVDDFGMSAFTLTFLVSFYLMGTVMLQMPAARMADLLGRRKTFLAGLALFTVFTLLCALAWSGTSLIVFRFAAGLSSALVFATNMAILTNVFPKEERGKVLGVNTAVVYAAVAIGPFGGGFMAHHLGWRSIFYVSFALSALALVLAWRSIKDEWTEAKGEPYDWRGSLVYALGIGTLVFGFSNLPSVPGWILFCFGTVACVGFIFLERKTDYPVIKLDLFFSNRNFSLSSLSAMINYSASFAVGFLISLYLQYAKGMPTDKAGMLMMTQPLAQTLLSPIAGRISDRINPSILTTGGMAAITAGLLAMAFFTVDTSTTVIIAILVLVGIGFAMFSSPNVNIIMGSVSSRYAGLASATTGTARQIGQSFSMAIASLVIHFYMGDSQLTRDNSHEYMPAMQACFLLFVVICLVGVYTSASKLTGGRMQENWRHISAKLPARDADSEEGNT